jgi:hypothetical protein
VTAPARTKEGVVIGAGRRKKHQHYSFEAMVVKVTAGERDKMAGRIVEVCESCRAIWGNVVEVARRIDDELKGTEE